MDALTRHSTAHQVTKRIAMLKYQSRAFKNAEKSMLIEIARVSHLGRIKSLVQCLSQYP